MSFSDFFTLDEQFVYAAAFLAPVLYIFYDAICLSWDSEKKDIWADFKNNIRGYEKLFFPTVVLILITASAYASSQQSDLIFKKTIFFVTFSGHNWIVYLLALLLWYTAILLETKSNTSLPEAASEDTDEMRAAAENFIQGKGENG